MQCSMTNIDEMEIAQSFKKRIDLGERQDKYEEVEWVALDDRNKLNYAGPIKFDTTELKDRMPVYRESYAAFPLSVTSSDATPYDAATRLAWKCSVLSLIRTLSVRPAGAGPQLVNEIDGGLPLMNNLRLLTASDIDWTECSGSELSFFGCDRSPPRHPMKDAVVLSPAQSHISQAVPDNDVFFNQRLADRVAVFCQPIHHATATKFEMVVTIPLKFIHSFFDQLGFVMPNYPMKIDFGLSSVTNGQDDLMPITTPKLTIHNAVSALGVVTLAATAAVAAVSEPALSIDPNISIKGFAPGACRLYIKCPVLKGADAAKMDSELSSGYKKTITYLTTDVYQATGVTTSANGQSYHRVFGENTKRPVRLWAMFPATGALANKNSVFPAAMGSCYVQDCNLKINGSLLRRTNFENQLELYNELRQYQLGSGYATQQGAPISYLDFINGVNPYLFDLSRHPTVLNNLPITFTFDGKLIDPAGNVPVDAIFLVERYQTAFINISKSKATTDVSDGISKEEDAKEKQD